MRLSTRYTPVSTNRFYLNSTRPQTSARPPVGRLYLLSVLTYGFFFTFWQLEPVPWSVHLLAVLVAATCFVPMALWYARGSRELPAFPLICLSYALQFSVPVYTQPNRVLILNNLVPLSWDHIAQALLAVELGLIALLAGYYLVSRIMVPVGSLPNLDLPFLSQKRKAYIRFATGLGGGVALLQLTGWALLANPALGAIVRLLATQLNLAIILLAYSVYGDERDNRGRLGLYGMVGFAAILGILSGMLESALIPLALLLIVRWHVTRRLPWLPLLLGLVFFLLVLNPAKFEYRQRVWYGGEGSSLVRRITAWFEAATNQMAGLGDPEMGQEYRQQSLTDSLQRFDLIHKFAYVQITTPAVVPYYQGETYSYFLYAWIPRFLWPDKPTAGEGNHRMDVDYGFKYSFQTGVTIGIGQLPEAYANFDLAGVIVVMAVQGLVFALLNRTLNGPHSEGGRAILLALLIYFLNGIGSSTVMWFGALAQEILANAVILRYFASDWQARSESPLYQIETPGSSKPTARIC